MSFDFASNIWQFYNGSRVFTMLSVLGSVGNTLPIHTLAVGIAGFFVLLSLCLSFYLMSAHLANYNRPEEQKWLIGVVFMVPVYSVESFASLWDSDISIECDILRNCYEAFALYCFGNYLIACLGGEEKILEILEWRAKSSLGDGSGKASSTKTALHHPFPLRLILDPWTFGQGCFRTIKFGIVQYMIAKTLSAILALLLELFGVYGDGDFKWNCGYPYITVVLNFSQTWALYCLVQFYNVMHEELKPIKPLAKFLCFKAIVFATWWQGVIIAILCSFEVLPGSTSGSSKFQALLQDFIICVEMAIAAVAHMFVFNTAPYLFFSKHEKVVVTSADSPSQEPLLEIDEVEEYGPDSYKRVVEADIKETGTSITESIQDVVLGGGETIVEDVKITVSQAVEPVEKGLLMLNEKLIHLAWNTKEGDENGTNDGVEGIPELCEHIEITTKDGLEDDSEHSEHIEVETSYTVENKKGGESR